MCYTLLGILLGTYVVARLAVSFLQKKYIHLFPRFRCDTIWGGLRDILEEGGGVIGSIILRQGARLAASGQLSKKIYSPVSSLKIRHNMGRLQEYFRGGGGGGVLVYYI